VSLGAETLIARKQIFSMQNYSFVPCGVCAKQISFSLESGKIHNLSFVNGCPGNLQAIGKLLEGEDATKAIRILKGNTCGRNSTSCADQLAIALEQALDKETAEGTPPENVGACRRSRYPVCVPARFHTGNGL
jgi:uncharacterized protein (TIGR03905 family)